MATRPQDDVVQPTFATVLATAGGSYSLSTRLAAVQTAFALARPRLSSQAPDPVDLGAAWALYDSTPALRHAIASGISGSGRIAVADARRILRELAAQLSGRAPPDSVIVGNFVRAIAPLFRLFPVQDCFCEEVPDLTALSTLIGRVMLLEFDTPHATDIVRYQCAGMCKDWTLTGPEIVHGLVHASATPGDNAVKAVIAELRRLAPSDAETFAAACKRRLAVSLAASTKSGGHGAGGVNRYGRAEWVAAMPDTTRDQLAKGAVGPVAEALYWLAEADGATKPASRWRDRLDHRGGGHVVANRLSEVALHSGIFLIVEASLTATLQICGTPGFDTSRFHGISRVAEILRQTKSKRIQRLALAVCAEAADALQPADIDGIESQARKILADETACVAALHLCAHLRQRGAGLLSPLLSGVSEKRAAKYARAPRDEGRAVKIAMVAVQAVVAVEGNSCTDRLLGLMFVPDKDCAETAVTAVRKRLGTGRDALRALSKAVGARRRTTSDKRIAHATGAIIYHWWGQDSVFAALLEDPDQDVKLGVCTILARTCDRQNSASSHVALREPVRRVGADAQSDQLLQAAAFRALACMVSDRAFYG